MKHLLISALTLLLVTSPLASAHHNKGYYKAKVLDSTPVYEYLTIPKPRHYCEPNRIRKTYYRHSNDSAIIGGVIGGTLGHVTSSRKNRAVGTITGAIVGSVIGHQLDRSRERHQPHYRVSHQTCLADYNQSSKVRVLQGYNVTYKLKGRIYQTFTEDKPGKRIRIYY